MQVQFSIYIFALKCGWCSVKVVLQIRVIYVCCAMVQFGAFESLCSRDNKSNIILR